MGVTVKRTFIRPKGREEYESKGMSTSQQISVVGQEVVAQGGGEKYTAGRGIDISNGVISVTQTPIVYNAGENITISGYTISSPNSVQSTKVKRIVPIKKEDYDALTAKSIDILYLVYVPQPADAYVEYQQTTDVPYQGAIITDNTFMSYFDYRVYCKFNDDSSLDVTSACTITVNNGYAVDISANTSTERIEAARPMVIAYLPEAYTSTTHAAVTTYVPIYQAGLVRELVNARLEGTWVTDVPADGGTITSANCTWDLYYIYSDETEELHTHYPDFYIPHPFEIEVGPNTTGTRKQLDAFQVMVVVSRPSPLTPIYVSTWITPYQEAGVPNNIIRYVSTNDSAITPYDTTVFGANIVSNTYYPNDGYGEIVFDGNVTSIGYMAFHSLNANSRLFSIRIPYSVLSIGEMAFNACGSLSGITIPDSVTTIGENAFYSCYCLSSITIPSSATTIGNDIVGNSRALSSITVDSRNTVYNDGGGSNCIIETATNKLIQGCKTTIIPNTVTTIGDYAFHACRMLSSITIPDSVITIGAYAFMYCDALSSITIPVSVTSIGAYAFSESGTLNNIIYNGTKAQWGLITKGNFWHAGSAANVVECTDGNIAI